MGVKIVISTTLYQNDIIKQDAKIAKLQKGLSLTNLLHNLIREYGTYADNSYDVDTRLFTAIDKKLLIANLETAEWFEYACSSESRLNAIYAEHAKAIQELVDDECFEVYQEDMEEMRAYR